MAMLNIPSSVTDPSYRYKMPRILSQKECRGQGSKTGILNVGDVAQHIQRDPVYLVKFFGYELGAQTTYTNKKSEGERAIVNGHHETSLLQTLVDRFVEKYVLCAVCNLPEIDMVVKRGLVVAQCKACRWKGELDNRHKLAAYISKNPPGSGIGFGAGESKKTKEERQRERAAKAQKKQGDENSETASYRSEDGTEEQKAKKEKKEKSDSKTTKPQTQGRADSEAASYQSDEGKEEPKGKKTGRDKKEKAEKKAKKAQEGKEGNGEGREDEDHEAKGVNSEKDKSDACKKDRHQRARAGQGGKRGEAHEKASDSDSGEEKASYEEDQELAFDDEIMAGVVKDIACYVQHKDNLIVHDFFQEVRAQQVTKAFDHKLRMYAVVSALFPEGTLDANKVRSRSEFITAFITNGTLPFADWVWGFEAYMAANPVAAKTWALTLKALYDEDLADEEDILAYYKNDHHSSPGFRLSQEAVLPLIKWLESTCDDEDSD